MLSRPLLVIATAAALGVACADRQGSSFAPSVAPSTAPAATTSATSPTVAAPGVARVTPVAGTGLGMDFSLASGFYAAPFPCESRRRPDGSVELSSFPNPTSKKFVRQTLDLIARDVRGFGTSSGVFFQASAALDPARLPAMSDTTKRTSKVFLLGVDAAAPDYLVRYPIDVAFDRDGGPHGAANLLSLLPLQGVPLREGGLYAAVVLRGLGDATGQDLGLPPVLADLANGVAPPGLSSGALDAYRRALAALRRDGIDLQQVAAVAAFRTDRPTDALFRVAQDALARPLPQPLAPFAVIATYPTYTVVRSTLRLPVYQHGLPPYLMDGGGWQLDPAGKPILAREETAAIVLTIPRAPMPAAGFPAVVMVRAGFGNGPLGIVERGRHPGAGQPAAPGSGPAMEFAASGFVGVQVDGPHGNLRNPTGVDEQVLMFNPSNPEAMRDNVRQSALELVVVGELLATLAVDPALCPGTATGGAPVRLDAGTVALFGHSMGATIAPLVLATSSRYRAAILSGAGGSWIENVMHKEHPFPVLPAAELLLGYPVVPRRLQARDPVLSLLQWAGEPADPPLFGRLVTREPRAGAPRHVLMLQGVADHYLPPPCANATSLSLGLDQGGASLDTTHPHTKHFVPLEAVLPFAGARRLTLPANGNRSVGGRAFTQVVVQHPEDGLEDGHEVVFQTDLPKKQYREFLRTFAAGAAPLVPQ